MFCVVAVGRSSRSVVSFFVCAGGLKKKTEEEAELERWLEEPSRPSPKRAALVKSTKI